MNTENQTTKHISDANAEPPESWVPDQLNVSQQRDFEAERLEQIVKQEKKEVARPMIKISESGTLLPSNIDEAWRLANVYCKSKTYPTSFDTPEKILVQMQMAAGINMNPVVAAGNMYYLNGKINFWGDLPLGLVRRSGQLEFISEKLYDKHRKEICFANDNLSEPPQTSVCIVKRKGEEKREFVWTWQQAEKAGLLAKNKSLWLLYPNRMMQMRVRSLALKDVFSDILAGISIHEYDDFNENFTPRDVSPDKSIPSSDELNKELQ
jgi:hypothetical protein